MRKHVSSFSCRKKNFHTSGSFSNPTEKCIAYEKEDVMSMSRLMDIEEFKFYSKISKSTIRRRIKDGSLKVWQPGGKGTRVMIYAENLLKSRESESFLTETKENNKNKKATNTSPHWLKQMEE